MNRPATYLAAALAAVLVLGLVAASARDPRNELAEAAEFDQVYRAAWGWLDGERDEQGTSYRHAAIRGPDEQADPPPTRPRPRTDLYSAWVQNEIDWVRLGRGDDLSTYYRQRNANGTTVSAAVLQPPRSNAQFVLVADRLRRPMLVPPYPKTVDPDAQQRFEPLVNTPFITRPSSFDAGWNPCLWSALADMCDIDRAWRSTRASRPGLPLLVTRQADGTTIARTGVRVIDLLKRGVVAAGGRDAAQLLPVGSRLVPFEVELRPDGTLATMRLHGAVASATVNVAVQIGVEIRGRADPTDIPAVPGDPTQYTVMDSLRALRFANDAASFYRSPATYQPDWRPDLPPLPLRATGPAVAPPL